MILGAAEIKVEMYQSATHVLETSWEAKQLEDIELDPVSRCNITYRSSGVDLFISLRHQLRPPPR